MQPPYTPPAYGKPSFNCPHCGAFSHQQWTDPHRHIPSGWAQVPNFKLSQCQHCNEFCLWHHKQLIYPPVTTAPMPNVDLPDTVKRDYDEARLILNGSPRGAAALLRLAIQKLCQHLGEPGDNLNADIGALVKKGLLVRVQQALDVVRVTGNNAVHPGQIELSDDVERASRLFAPVNIIADQTITQPKHVEELFNALPDTQRAQIDKRDEK